MLGRAVEERSHINRIFSGKDAIPEEDYFSPPGGRLSQDDLQAEVVET